MSLFVQDVFAEAKALGLLVGFVGTYSDLHQAVLEATEPFDPDEDGSLAFARWAEGGWHGGRLTDEEAEDRARNPFDPQTGVFNDENDPDGEGWNAYCEQQGDRAAEAKASAWFNFRDNIPF